jgi:hypothetical protein
MQRIGVTSVRFGAGSDVAARLIYGADKWDTLKPAERAALLDKMKAGVGTDAAAMNLLGITPAQLAADGVNGDLSKRIGAVRNGLLSNAHLRNMLGSAADKPGMLADVRSGLFSSAVAKSRLGLPADAMPPDVATEILRRREAWGNEAEARRLLGLSPDGDLSIGQRTALGLTTRNVGIIRKMSPDDEAAVLALQEKDAKLQRMAASRGLSVEQIRAGGNALLLSDTETDRLQSTRRSSSLNASKLNALHNNAAALRSQIARLGDDIGDESKNSLRRKLQAQLKGVEAQIASGVTTQSSIEAVVADDAKKFSVSPANYLRGQGWMDKDGLALFNSIDAERQADIKKVQSFADGLELKPGDLTGVMGTIDRLKTVGQDAVRKMTTSPVDITRDILKEYGFSVGETPSDFERGFGSLVSATGGKDIAERILSSRRELLGFAGRKKGGDPGSAGVDSMAKAYYGAAKSGKAEDMLAFRKAYGLLDVDSYGQVTGSSNYQFEQLEKAMQFQQQTGLLSFGGAGDFTKNAQRELTRIYSTAVGGEVKGLEKAEAGTQRHEITGTLTLRQDGKVDIVGGWGGGRAFIPGGN